MAKKCISILRTAAGVLCLVLSFPLLLLTAWICEVCKKLRKEKSVAGEVAVVTGAANGLGKEIAIELARKGCSIAVVDIDYENAQHTAELISERFNVKVKAYQVDVSNYEAVVKLNKNVTEDLGPTTILINNAAFLVFSNQFQPNWREMQTMINVNLTAHFWTNNVFLPKMKDLKKGHIVAIASAAALFPLPYSSVYSSTKFGVRALMRSLSLELQHEHLSNNIHTSTVYTHFMNTNPKVVDITRQGGFEDYYPLISGEDAARRIVQGMLHNKKEIVVPGFLILCCRLVDTLPASWRDWLVWFVSETSLQKLDVLRLPNKIKNSYSQ